MCIDGDLYLHAPTLLHEGEREMLVLKRDNKHWEKIEAEGGMEGRRGGEGVTFY